MLERPTCTGFEFCETRGTIDVCGHALVLRLATSDSPTATSRVVFAGNRRPTTSSPTPQLRHQCGPNAYGNKLGRARWRICGRVLRRLRRQLYFDLDRPALRARFEGRLQHLRLSMSTVHFMASRTWTNAVTFHLDSMSQWLCLRPRDAVTHCRSCWKPRLSVVAQPLPVVDVGSVIRELRHWPWHSINRSPCQGFHVAKAPFEAATTVIALGTTKVVGAPPGIRCGRHN